jgi:hypothetical protein
VEAVNAQSPVEVCLHQSPDNRVILRLLGTLRNGMHSFTHAAIQQHASSPRYTSVAISYRQAHMVVALANP